MTRSLPQKVRVAHPPRAQRRREQVGLLSQLARGKLKRKVALALAYVALKQPTTFLRSDPCQPSIAARQLIDLGRLPRASPTPDRELAIGGVSKCRARLERVRRRRER
jgi:hypothetical protein